MKLIFLLFVVPFATVAQDLIREPILIEPIEPIRLTKPPPSTTTITPRILPDRPFVVVSNAVIRRNSPFNVAIQRFGSNSRTVSLTITLTGTSDDGTPYAEKKNAIIRNLNTRIWVSFDTSKIPRGSYFLNVEGEGFRDKRQLIYAQKDTSLLVQLEKAIYSPGQTVRFRVFAIDSLTNAVNPSDRCAVSIRDSNGNLIEGYEPKFVKGKYENKLTLGEKAPQGIWGVEVSCGIESAYEQFEVAEYKLPAFSASLNVPSQIPFSDGKVPFQITAVYSFGDPVEGTATLEIGRWGETILARKNIEIVNGEASFELDVTNDLSATANSWWYYDYTLIVTDSTLNSKAQVEGFFQVVPNKYNIVLTGNQFITPGSSYSFSVSVSSTDGSFPSQGTIVNIIIYTNSQTINEQVVLNNVGTGSLSVTVPKDSTYFSIQATAKESNTGYLYAYVQQGSPGSITLFPNYRGEESAKLGEWFDIKAVVTDNVDWIVYYVASKGVLLDTQRVTFRQKSQSVTIWVKPDIRYFPRFTVIAAYLKGVDIISNQITIQAKDRLNNFVTLDFSDVEVKPGTNYSFNVDSICDSTVSLSAIDQRVLQLKSGNEVLFDDVFNTIQSYEWNDWMPWEDRYIPQYEWSFRNAKLQILTNIPPPPRPEYFYSDMPMEMQPEFREQERKEAARPGGSDDVKIRKDFSETFCWTDVDTNRAVRNKDYDNACRANVNCKVPDSITKYLVYSVSMNTKHGIGVTDVPSNITVKLPFFMVWDPPYSIQRNEILVIDIAFFNSINQDQEVVITILKNNNFAAVDLSTYGWTETATGYEQTYLAKASTNFKVQFGLTFLNMGIFNIQIVARGPLAGDGIEKPVRVIPEGIPRTITRSVMIVGNDPASTDLTCEYPEGTYEDTKSVLSTVIGDLLGKALNNLDNLIQMPGGCGEQNLISLVPDLAIHKYLQVTGKLTPALDLKLKQYEAAGVQNQLSYRRYDGSFSAFGNSDPNGSTWLTIYSALAFYWAKSFVTVDDNIIREAVNFVIAQQQPDGSFSEPGRVIHVDMQGGTSNGLGMAAYISIALTEMLPSYPEYQTARDNAISYLISASTSDVYELGIIARALLVAEDSNADAVFNSFVALRIESATEIFWQKTVNPPNFWYSALSLDIEVSSYGLLNYVVKEETANAIKVAKYLTSQANNFGGYSSSQDTVMALIALAKFAESFTLNGANVALTLTPNVGSSFSANVDSSNVMTLQQFELDSQTTNLNVAPSSSSTGLAIVSLICNYYQDPASVVPFFKVSSEYYRQCRWSIGLRVCASYIPKGSSNMAIITVNLPSGFQYQEWWGGPKNREVTKVETYNSGSRVVFYFNTIGNRETCVDVNAYRAQTVSELKGGTIIVNDYYDTSKEGTAKYEAPDLSGQCYWGR